MKKIQRFSLCLGDFVARLMFSTGLLTAIDNELYILG